MSDFTRVENSAEHILARIKNEGILPRPKWHFLLREGSVWAVGALSVSVGALAVAGMLFEMTNTWWDLYEATHDNFLTFILEALPFIWTLGFIFFAGVAYASIRYSKRGYRYPLHILLLGSLVLSGVIGVVLHAIGAGQFVDERVGAYVPLHRSLMDRERSTWMHPADGRVAGIVREMAGADGFLALEGVDRATYLVDINGFSPEDQGLIRVGDQLRLLGVPTTTSGFIHACAVLMKRNDILRRLHAAHAVEERQHMTHEKNLLLARSTECKGVRPYARLAPIEP